MSINNFFEKNVDILEKLWKISSLWSNHDDLKTLLILVDPIKREKINNNVQFYQQELERLAFKYLL